MMNDALTCPRCDSPMVLRKGQFGEFYGCTKFRSGCRGTRPGPNQVIRQNFRGGQATGAHKPLVGSPEQDVIWEYIVNGTGHLIVDALAGCGKSTTCREALHRVDSRLRVLYLAFNREIVNEFKAKAPPHVTVSTLNSTGWQQVLRSYPRCTIQADKIEQIIDEVFTPSAAEAECADSIRNITAKLVALCQGALISGTETEALLELVTRFDIELPGEHEDRIFKLVPEVLALCKDRTNLASFNCQLWLPVVLNLPCDKYDLIFVDEAQDLNTAQHQLVLRLLAPAGRVVVVGDVNQAIYGFRGSDAESIPNFKALLAQTGKNVHTLPLTVTRRCGKAIVEEAKIYVPNFTAHENNGLGMTMETDDEKAVTLYEPRDMVLCRLNAPLTAVAYQLISRGVKAVIRGRDIGQGLVALINRLKPRSISDLEPKLEKWMAKELRKVAGTKREETVRTQVEDKANCIRALAGGCNNLSEVKSRIESLFSNFEADGAPKNAVILSSIHRAKGLEAPKVYWLYPDKSCKVKQEWQAQQERNLRYVAITRAINTLVYVHEKKAA